jgi:hypothetical protein
MTWNLTLSSLKLFLSQPVAHLFPLLIRDLAAQWSFGGLLWQDR